MKYRIAIAVLANLTAVIVPVYALYVRYGIAERVQPEAAEKMFFLAAAMVAAFAISFLAGTVIRQAKATDYSHIIQSAIHALKDHSDSSSGPQMRAKSA